MSRRIVLIALALPWIATFAGSAEPCPQADTALKQVKTVQAKLLASSLMETGRPQLVVPYVSGSETVGTNVLVAWDGGREASRALADAMPLLLQARQVTVICLDPDASNRGADALGRERLAAYLRCHAVSARIQHDDLGTDEIAIGDWLLSRVADLSGDLIVMGGYGHARWREQLLGGATRTLLGSMTVPVLMSH